MAHNVTVKDRMLSGRGQKPWHYNETKDRTTVVDGLVSATEILEAAGLNWRGDKRPVFFRAGDGSYQPISEFVATVAVMPDKSEDYIGTAADDTPLFQPQDLVDFSQAALDASLQAETAGSLRAKKIVWIQWAMPEGIKIGGYESEKMDLYFLTTVGFDPRGNPLAFSAKPTAVRVVCNNTWSYAMAGGALSIAHQGDMMAKASELRSYYQVTYENYGKNIQELAEALAAKSYTAGDLKSFAHDLFPAVKTGHKARDEERELWSAKRRVNYLDYLASTPDLAPIRDNYYGLVQAATGFDSWGRSYGSQSRRFEHLNGLAGENLGQRATGLAIKATGAALSSRVQEQLADVLGGAKL